MATVNKKEIKSIFDTKIVQETRDKIDQGAIITSKRYNPFYENDIELRRGGLVFKMTPHEEEEFDKCFESIEYFSATYCLIKSEDGTRKKLKLRDYQERILDLYKNRKSVLMGSRQIGKTINAALTILHYALFNYDKNILIVANKLETTKEIVNKIKDIYRDLPFFLKPGVENWNEKQIKFDNGCIIKSSATSKTAAVGNTIDFLFIDEMAHIDTQIMETFFKSVIPTVSSINNSKIIVVSTPNGYNKFHELLTEAEEGRSNWKPMRVYWYEVKDKLRTHYRFIKEQIDKLELKINDIFNIINDDLSDRTKVELIEEDGYYTIKVYYNDFFSEEETKTYILNINGLTIPIQTIAKVTTWKEDEIADLGSVEYFDQEYGLKFLNGDVSLLDENSMSGLKENIIPFKKTEYEHVFNKRISFPFSDYFKVIDDESIFKESDRKKTPIAFSIDLAEGIGLDFSVINVYKVAEKKIEDVKFNIRNINSIYDCYKLEQIAMFRSNCHSIKLVSEFFYNLIYEYFDSDLCRGVVEMNNYGPEFISHLPYLYDGNNDYNKYIFVKYKHRVDSDEEKIGIKVNDNKNLLVKDFQDEYKKKSIVLHNEIDMKEINSFTKQVSSQGNVKFSAERGRNDDAIMTDITVVSMRNKKQFNFLVDEYIESTLSDKELHRQFELILSGKEENDTYSNNKVSNSFIRETIQNMKLDNIRRRHNEMLYGLNR